MKITQHALVVLILLVVVPTASGDDVWVSIRAPRSGDVAVGAVDVLAEVVATNEVEKVEFRLDGRLVGTLSEPPYLYRVDLGSTRQDHLIAVVAHDATGTRGSDEVVTRAAPLGGDIELDLQQLYVTVELDGQRVLDLEPSSFSIGDDGEDQQLITFERGDSPFTAVLLIDSSVSMYGTKIDAAWQGAGAFVRGMKELDEGKVIAFCDHMVGSTPFTPAKDVLTSGIGGGSAHGGTALNDHLYMALKMLDQRQGRRVVVLLSDGIDTHSVLTMPEVFAKARRSQVIVYWIRLGHAREHNGALSERTRMYSAWRNPSEYKDQLRQLEELVNRSGGRIVPVMRDEEIRTVFMDVLAELREQYVLGYYPSDNRNDGRWHDVKVDVRHPRAMVRAHDGYIDFIRTPTIDQPSQLERQRAAAALRNTLPVRDGRLAQRPSAWAYRRATAITRVPTTLRSSSGEKPDTPQRHHREPPGKRTGQ